MSMNNKNLATISNYANQWQKPDVGLIMADLNADSLMVLCFIIRRLGIGKIIPLLLSYITFSFDYCILSLGCHFNELVIFFDNHSDVTVELG